MSEEIIKGYCMHCHEKQPIKDPQEIEMKGKGSSIRRAVKGICPICSTVMYRFLPKRKEEPNPQKELSNFDKESQIK